MSALLQRLSRVNTIHAVYMWICFATMLIFLHLPGFHILINQNASFLRNVSIVAKVITCKHYTCCIHVDIFCNNVDISTFAWIPYFDKPKRLFTKKYQHCCKGYHVQTMYMLYTRDSLCNNVDISANAGIPYFDQLKRHLPRNVSIVAKAITCRH